MKPVREIVATRGPSSTRGSWTRAVLVRHSDDELDELAQLFNRMLDKTGVIVGMRDHGQCGA